MSKILVDISVPAADKRSDVLIPYECPLWEATELVRAVFADDPDSSFTPTHDTILCDGSTGSILDVNLSARELGLRNGSRLLLI